MTRPWPGRHFTWAELLTTSHRDLAREQQGGAEGVRLALEALVVDLLDPLREAIGRPIRVNSAYRCPRLNARVGGSSTSQHLKGEAADLAVPGWSDEQLYELWRRIGWGDLAHLPYGQCIFEDARPNEEGGAWLHFSLGPPWRRATNSGQRITWSPAAGYRRFDADPGPR